jgi:ABC-type nitrate/sulfonate/bicarbonate transport system substrate-binding protein
VIRFGVPDLISPSYFPVIAAVELGILREKGLESSVGLVFPVSATYEALRSGDLDYVGGAAHAAASVFPDWRGCRLLAALSQGMYWFLVVRVDSDATRDDLTTLRGLRIGAAPGPVDGLRAILEKAGLDADEDVQLTQVRGSAEEGASFGLTAANALERGEIDGFWANGMAADVATQRGIGRVLIDARRGDGPPGSTGFTFPALVATAEKVRDQREEVALVVGSLQEAQRRLIDDPTQATVAARRAGFPEYEASLIARLIERDSPFYESSISRGTFEALRTFTQEIGLSTSSPRYEDVVSS